MIKYQVYNQQGEVVGEKNLNEKVFGLKPNADLLHQATVAQMANGRKVIAHTKDRSEVAGGGKKPWRQKGTGRARVGSSRSPIWRGGGITFGPTNNRNFSKEINKKMKQQALLMALSDKVESKQLVIIDKWNLADAKTKAFNQVLTSLEKKALGDKVKRSWLIVNKGDEKLTQSARNLAYTKTINLDNINLVDILNFKNLLVSSDIIEALEKQYAK
jgi:large subunit ribosomal protein L4